MFNDINKNIVLTLGINTLPIEKQKETMERLGAIVYQEVMLRVLDILSEEDKDAFEKLIEKDPNPENIFGFLSEKITNLDEIVKEEAEKLREESAEIISEIGK
ncbi:MAG: DUF5663 domain-containing protein [Candidatus Paceibacterota bacterium]|jgi:hypothetical protein